MKAKLHPGRIAKTEFPLKGDNHNVVCLGKADRGRVKALQGRFGSSGLTL